MYRRCIGTDHYERRIGLKPFRVYYLAYVKVIHLSSGLFLCFPFVPNVAQFVGIWTSVAFRLLLEHLGGPLLSITLTTGPDDVFGMAGATPKPGNDMIDCGGCRAAIWTRIP
jgi:hypothetical protein